MGQEAVHKEAGAIAQFTFLEWARPGAKSLPLQGLETYRKKGKRNKRGRGQAFFTIDCSEQGRDSLLQQFHLHKTLACLCVCVSVCRHSEARRGHTGPGTTVNCLMCGYWELNFRRIRRRGKEWGWILSNNIICMYEYSFFKFMIK